MGFRFQRRLNLGSGLGLNLGKTGASASGRTFFGSVGTGGFSVRSGIPGLSYRKSFGRGGAGLLVGLVALVLIFAVNLAMLMVALAVNVLLVIIQVLWATAVVAAKLLVWSALTTSDFISYIATRHAVPPPPPSRTPPPPPESSSPLPPLPVHGRPPVSPTRQ